MSSQEFSFRKPSRSEGVIYVCPLGPAVTQHAAGVFFVAVGLQTSTSGPHHHYENGDH